MATVEKSGSIKYKSTSGDTTIFYPNTLADNVYSDDYGVTVEALFERSVSHFSNKTNPHEVTAEQVGALSSTPVSMASTDGAAYTCTVPGIDSLTAGASFIGIPAIVSTSTSVTLNVNNLGAKQLRRGVSTSSSTTTAGYNESWLAAGKPLRIMYDGLFWIVDNARPYAADLMGTVPIANGGTGATDGATGLANLFAAGSTVLSSNQYGETLPTAGSAGRVFFKKSDGSDMEAINAHISDTTKHITAAERTAWNAKQDKIPYTCVPAAFTDAIDDNGPSDNDITIDNGCFSVISSTPVPGQIWYDSYMDIWRFCTSVDSTANTSTWKCLMLENDVKVILSNNQTLVFKAHGADYATYATINSGVAVGTPALRNEYFVSAEATPTVNGQIAWVYG